MTFIHSLIAFIVVVVLASIPEAKSIDGADNNFAVESPHNNNNTKSPPKYSTNGTTYTTLKMTIFLPIFVCLVKMFFINYDSESQSKLSKC